MSEPFLGQIQMFGFNFNPRGWAKCDGQLLPISQNSALFSLLGTQYGGDGRTTFGLPGLRGRVPIHQGNGPGLLPKSIGSKGGQETVALNATEIPSHTHSATGNAKAAAGRGNNTAPAGRTWAGLARENAYSDATADTDMMADNVEVTVGNTGGSQSHNNMQPYLTVNFCIALTGIFPSRS